MNNKNITHIVFDLDDTLTDSYAFNQNMFVETFRPYTQIAGETESYLRQLHKESRGVSMLTQFETAINFLKLKAKPETMVKENENLHINNAGSIRAFTSTRALLNGYKNEGKVLSICTNRQSKSTETILRSNGLENYFSKIVSCSDEGYEKPNPFCLRKLMEEFGVENNQILYVGDSNTDMLFANNAGVNFEMVDFRK